MLCVAEIFDIVELAIISQDKRGLLSLDEKNENQAKHAYIPSHIFNNSECVWSAKVVI